MENLGRVELRADAWHAWRRSRQLASMKSISIPTLTLKNIHSRGNEAVAAAIDAPG